MKMKKKVPTEEELTKFQNGNGFAGPCELVVGIGQKPID